MEIINYSVQWARAEVFSAQMVFLLGLVTLLVSLGFYVFGETPIARAYILPMLLSGLFLVAAAGGLYYANKPRVEHFSEQYEQNAKQFVQSELERTAKSDHDLHLMVYRVLPAIVIACAVAVFFVTGAYGRAWLVSLMILGSVMMAIDSNTHRRTADYRQQLIQYEQKV